MAHVTRLAADMRGKTRTAKDTAAEIAEHYVRGRGRVDAVGRDAGDVMAAAQMMAASSASSSVEQVLRDTMHVKAPAAAAGASSNLLMRGAGGAGGAGGLRFGFGK